MAVVYGPVESQKIERNGRVLGEALLNPTVLVEVLSKATEEYDRGEKFAHYMRIPSLREYVLVSQDTPRIEVFRRPERGHWIQEEARAGGTIAIAGRTIHVGDIYRRASGSRQAAPVRAPCGALVRRGLPPRVGHARGA